MTSLRCHTMLCHRQPHPEEPRPSDALGVNSARRLEGWATTVMYPTLRDGPSGLLRVRLGLYQHSMRASTSYLPGGARIDGSSITAVPTKLPSFTTVTSSGMYISPTALK